MTPTFAAKKGGSRYRFYACVNALKHGRQVCPSPWLPALDIERTAIELVQEFCEMHFSRSAPNKTLGQFLDLSTWNALPAPEQARLVREIVQRVDYDGREGKVAISFHPPDHKTTSGTPFLSSKDNDP
jgi:hypothetical protein